MQVRIAPLREPFVTNRTVEGILLGVDTTVHLKRSTLTKAFSTKLAYVGFALVMRVLVVAEVVLTSEPLATGFAFVWSFVGVSAFVDD